MPLERESPDRSLRSERIRAASPGWGGSSATPVDIANVGAGKLAVAPSPGNLAVVIAEAADMFQKAAASRGITLEGLVAAALLNASFDHNHILQVLGNPVPNALKYTPRGGRITLVGERDDSGVRLTVSDAGSGIPEEALESVFERFTQVGANEHGGLGLGLHIALPGPRAWWQHPSGE